MSLFQNSVLNKYLNNLEYEKVNEAYTIFTNHFHNPTIQENIRNAKEEQYQGEFLIDLFVNVLGYTKNPAPNFNLTTELKNIRDSKKTDGAILKGEKALAVIELKGTNTTDLNKVENQAFGYKNNQTGCHYVITSNFEKLRFYIDNAVEFEEFNLFKLTKDRFDLLWVCLSSEYLLKDIPKKIKDESLTQEENITKKLYKDYASFRNEIFDAIQKENPQYDKLTLFKKTQKLLDRFLFIFFAEDRLLLPPNSIRSIVNQWTDLRDKYDEYFPLYDRFKKYFGYMNTGHKGQQHDIFAYNGGLFAPDDILDNIEINDDLLYKHTLKLSNYDFESEVSVNILGHIFEHSLNDIDEIQAEIQGITTDQSKTKRKKDGVFYTPKYITKYIVEHTVGKLCEEKKAELNIQEAEYEKERKGRQKSTLKKLSQQLEEYRNWLLQLTICDPACGSGAFLNQALEFLMAEHRYIDELQAKLFGDAMVLSEVENAILENNLFGVDINEESVEIAKLSLWLRTAQKGRKLTSLNNNIKCGNSLIDDPAVAGDKAFHWQKEFPDVFREKHKKAYHITTALHDSRTSQRMIDYKVRERRDSGANPLPNYQKLTTEEEIQITQILVDIVTEDELHVMAYNICGDHMHLLLVCEEHEVPKIMQKIKSKTARAVNIARGITTITPTREPAPLPTEESTSPMEHAPLPASTPLPGTSQHADLPIEKHAPLPRGKKQNSLWTQKYGNNPIKDDKQLNNTLNYIQQNRVKHELKTHPELQTLLQNPVLNQSYEQAFATAYAGGFDVVIGNPPYVVLSPNEFVNYKYTTGNNNTYVAFFELGLRIINKTGELGYIVPNTWFSGDNFSVFRNYIISQNNLKQIIQLPYDIFQAYIDTSIILLNKTSKSKNTYYYKYEIREKQSQINFDNFLKFPTKEWIKYGKIFLNTDLLKIGSKVWFSNKNEKLGNISKINRGTLPPKENEKSINRDTHFNIRWFDNQIFRYVEQGNIQVYVNYESLRENKKMEVFKGKRIFARQLMSRQFRMNVSIIDYDCAFKKNIYVIYDLDKNYTDEYVLAILNSKLFSFIQVNFNTSLQRDDFPAFSLKDFKHFSIAKNSIANQKLFFSKVNLILNYSKSFEKSINEFLQLLTSKFSIKKPSKKLQNWHELDFGEFLKELEKARKKEATATNKEFQPLGLAQEAEWMQYFNEQKQKATELKTQINQTDREIDQMVYELYGLTEEEIAIIEESVK